MHLGAQALLSQQQKSNNPVLNKLSKNLEMLKSLHTDTMSQLGQLIQLENTK